MKRWFPLLMLLVASLVFGAGAGAQTPGDGDDDLIFRANGDVTVARDEVIEAVIVANGNARVEGSVTSTLWVISGDAIVEGSVGDDVIVIDGTLELTRGAEVENVTLIRGTLERADGAIVSGTITEQNALMSLGWGAAVFSMVMWLGVTLALVVAAVVFAAVAGRHLAGAGEVVRHRFGASIVTALVLWIALPILAVMAFVTIVGIPLGVSVFLLVLPVLWIAGYLVVTTRVGDAVLGWAGMGERPPRLVIAAAIGVVLFQVIGLIPGIGPLIVALSGVIGSGALVYRTVERPLRQQPAVIEPEPQPAV